MHNRWLGIAGLFEAMAALLVLGPMLDAHLVPDATGMTLVWLLPAAFGAHVFEEGRGNTRRVWRHRSFSICR